MLRFSLFGIPVAVQPWFWVVMALIGGGVTANTRDEFLKLALFVLAGFISILAHELGHALTGRAFGARSSITLHSMGGLAEFQGTWFTRKQSFLVTAAGPGVQFLLGLAVFLAILKLGPLTSMAGYFWGAFASISMFWAVVNLVPILPLDGGQMLHAVLGPQRLRITLWTTIVCAVALGGLALLFVRGPGVVILVLMLGYFAYQAWQRLRGVA